MKPFVLDEPIDGTFFPELNEVRVAGDLGYGYYNVTWVSDNRVRTGYRFDYIYNQTPYTRYNYYRSSQKGYQILTSISIAHLRKKVLNAGYEWKVINPHLAALTLSMNLLDLYGKNINNIHRFINDNI